MCACIGGKLIHSANELILQTLLLWKTVKRVYVTYTHNLKNKIQSELTHPAQVIFSINSDLVLDLSYLREEAESYFTIVCILSYIYIEITLCFKPSDAILTPSHTFVIASLKSDNIQLRHQKIYQMAHSKKKKKKIQSKNKTKQNKKKTL